MTKAHLGDSINGMDKSLLEESSGPSSSSTLKPNSSYLNMDIDISKKVVEESKISYQEIFGKSRFINDRIIS